MTALNDLPDPTLTDAIEYARRQIELADTGRADNQCPSCKVYRADGLPPPSGEHKSHCSYSGIPPLPEHAWGARRD